MFEDGLKNEKSQTEKTEYKYNETNSFAMEKEPEKREQMFSIQKKREENIEKSDEKNDISFSAQHEGEKNNREKSVIFAIRKGDVLKEKDDTPNIDSDFSEFESKSEAHKIQKKTESAKEYAYKHTSTFKTRQEMSGYKFEQKSTANNTFNSADVATGVASAGASKIAQETSSSEDEMQKKQFFINTAVAAGKIAVSGGADTGEAVASYAKSTISQISQSSKSKKSMSDGNGGGAVVVMLFLLITIISTVMTLSVVYPFYMTNETVTGYVTAAGDFIKGTLDDIKNFFGSLFGNEDDYTKTEKNEIVSSDFKDTVKHYSQILDGVVGEDNARINAMFGGTALDTLDTFDELDAEMLAEEFGMNWDVEQYRKDCIEYENGGWKKGMECPVLTDYYDGGKGNKKWEGYEWSPETEGTKVPTGKMYDETLWITAAYNDSIMTDGEPVVHIKTVTKENPDTGEEYEEEEIDYIDYVVPSEAVFMTDEQVKKMYDDAEYWDLSVCFEEYECEGCETRSYTYTVVDNSTDPPTVTKKTGTEKYCPGHIKGVVCLKFNWSTDVLIEKLHPGKSYDMFYDIIEEQYSKDKKR